MLDIAPKVQVDRCGCPFGAIDFMNAARACFGKIPTELVAPPVVVLRKGAKG